MTTASAPPLPLPPGSQPAAPALGRHTARGFVWMFLQTILTKGAGILGQVVTAWFLAAHDFKLVGLTYAIAAFPSLIRDSGLQTILVQRQRHLRRWAGPVFWMSACLGLAGAVVMAVIAPIAARIYGEPALTGLILITALGGMFTALGTVPAGVVQIRLRFRLQAVVAAGTTLFMQALIMLMAWRGYGAYSYIFPNAVSGGVTALAYWLIAPTPIPWRLHLRRWRFLLPDSGTLLAAGLVTMAISQGDYLTINLLHRGPSDDTGGIFFFAFNLSWQTLVLLTFTVGSVLFPTLSKLQQDRPRQLQAYLRTVRTIALVGIPLCFLQAALADPVFHLVFKPKWYPAIPVMQVLCLAMGIRSAGLTWLTLTGAQGRFRMQLLLNCVFCVLFLISVFISAKFGGALTVAITEACFFAVVDPLAIYVVLRANGLNSLREVQRIFVVPLLSAAAAVGSAYLVGQLLSSSRLGDLGKVIVISCISAGIYVALIRKISPADWKEVMSLRRFRTSA